MRPSERLLELLKATQPPKTMPPAMLYRIFFGACDDEDIPGAVALMREGFIDYCRNGGGLSTTNRWLLLACQKYELEDALAAD